MEYFKQYFVDRLLTSNIRTQYIYTYTARLCAGPGVLVEDY